jgi:alpha-N-acetylglucosaminidase
MDMMPTTVYSNTNASTEAATKSTTVNYDLSVLTNAWNMIFDAATSNPSLWDNPASAFDMVDITWQVMSNSFNIVYADLINMYHSPSPSSIAISAIGKNISSLLTTLGSVLPINPSFLLSTRINAARSLSANATFAEFYGYNARNQITLWGPNGEIHDYASKSWGGLVSGYYIPRWEIFTQYLMDVGIEL